VTALAAARRAVPAGRAVPVGRVGSAVVLGVGADVLFGDPRRGHPVAGFGRAAGAFERVVYRPTRPAGAIYAAVLAGVAAGLGALLERAVGRRLARALCLWVALGGRSLAGEAQAVGELVARGDLPGARRRIRSLVGRDPEQLDAHGLSRAAIESVAENTVDAVIAPLLWLRAGGAPGVLAHRAVNTLDAMVGHRSPRYERFGTAAARADDVMNWPAARLAAALTVLLSGRPLATWRAWRADAHRHPSPNAGQIEAAFAGALGVRLGGTLAYAGRVEHRPDLGEGRDPGPDDILRAIALARRIGLAAALLAALPARRRRG
jgi:adenosylcobinamide-phosphate synthase